MSAPRHVSSRVTANALEALDSLRWIDEPDWEAQGLARGRLRAQDQWLSWEEYRRFLRALAGPEPTPERHREVGRLVMRHAADTPFRHLGRLVGGVRPLIESTYTWVLPRQIPVIHPHVERSSEHGVVVVLALDPELSDGTELFHTIAGTLEELPTLLAEAPAIVEATITPREARYELQLAPSASLRARLGRAWSTLVDTADVDVTLSEIVDNVQGTMAGLRDANRRLAASEQRWQALTANLPGIVAVVDREGTIEALHGGALTPDEPPTSVMSLLSPTDRLAARELLAHVFHSGEPVAAEMQTNHSSGVRWWACRASRLPEPTRAVIVAVEITDRKRAQGALRASEQRIVRAQKLEAVGRLAGGLAHDVNNVLTSVRAHAELLGMRNRGDEAVAGAVDGILTAVDRASALTRQLLAYGRPTTGEERVVDVNEVVEETRVLVERLLGSDVVLVTHPADTPLLIRIDPTQLQQVVLNLVLNARDAMRAGGTVTVTTIARDADVELVVADTGEGMSPEVRARAFEPFFTTKEVGRGTGLGLSTVYWIVKQSGGSLDIDSTANVGTTMRIRFPRAHDAIEAVDEPGPAPRGAGQLVLLVEDEEEVRDLVGQLLDVLEYRVIACADAAEAIEVLADAPVDLLLTDIAMPGMSGAELASIVARDWPHLPVLMMSAYSQEAPSELTARAAHHAFLAKPFGLTKLASALEGLLGTRA